MQVINLISFKTKVMEENTTALSAQNQDNLSENSTQEMLELAGDNKISEFPDYSTMNLKDIIQAFQDMLDRADQQELYKNADAMKAAFYKVLKREKVAAGVFEESAAVDGEPEEQVASNDAFGEIEKVFKEVYSRYKESRANYVQELEKVKEENLAKKLEIIDKIKELLDKECNPKDYLITTVGCAIGAHTGRGIVGICFFDADNGKFQKYFEE